MLPVFGSHFRDGQKSKRGRPHLNAARDLQTVKDPYRKLAIRTMKSGRGGAGGSTSCHLCHTVLPGAQSSLSGPVSRPSLGKYRSQLVAICVFSSIYRRFSDPFRARDVRSSCIPKQNFGDPGAQEHRSKHSHYSTCSLEREQLEAVALQKITQDQDERPGLSGTTRAGAGPERVRIQAHEACENRT